MSSAPVLLLHISTQLDVALGQQIYGLTLNPDDAQLALSNLCRQDTGHTRARLPLHQVVCAHLLLIDGAQLRFMSYSQQDLSEAHILQQIERHCAEHHGPVLTWAGTDHDLPIVLHRAMYHRISAPAVHALTVQPSRHLALQQCLAFGGPVMPSQRMQAQCLGLNLAAQPAAADTTTHHWPALSTASEQHLLITWWLYMRWQQVCGQISNAQYDQQFEHARHALAQQSRLHDAFLTAFA